MSKERKPGVRRPPVPADGHGEIDDWMNRAMPELQPLLRHLDTLIRKTIPGLSFALKWKKAHYGLPARGWVIEMVAYDVSVNLVFHAGADFHPPPPLGTTGRTRYVKLRTLEEAQAPEVRDWVEQARSHAGWK